MCSWCWGFAPTIKELSETYKNSAPLAITTGGLHAYDTHTMDNQYKDIIRHHWEDVEKATGANFDYSFFDRIDFVLDTEPACRAVVVVRKMEKAKALAFYELISRSFYKENQDTTDTNTLKKIAEEIDLDPEEFIALFESDLIKQDTLDDFRLTQRLGITGFPTLIAKEKSEENQKLALISAGYQPYENLIPVIEHWLKNGLEDTANE